jgi:hypothetical protein
VEVFDEFVGTVHGHAADGIDVFADIGRRSVPSTGRRSLRSVRGSRAAPRVRRRFEAGGIAAGAGSGWTGSTGSTPPRQPPTPTPPVELARLPELNRHFSILSTRR